MLCKKKRATRSFSLLIPSSLLPLSIYILVFLLPPCQPVTHRRKDPTVRSHSHFWLRLLSVEDWWRGVPTPPPTPIVSRLFRCWQPVLLFFNMGGVGGRVVVVIVFFFFWHGGVVCESYFSSFRRNKAHVMLSCPPPSPSVSHICPLPPPLHFFPVCLCLCALCEPLSLLITIKVHPQPPSW